MMYITKNAGHTGLPSGLIRIFKGINRHAGHVVKESPAQRGVHS